MYCRILHSGMQHHNFNFTKRVFPFLLRFFGSVIPVLNKFKTQAGLLDLNPFPRHHVMDVLCHFTGMVA